MDRKLAQSGGGGNRTRVPRYFSVRFYVCSLSCFGGRDLAAPLTLFAQPVPGKQGPGQTNRTGSLAVTASGAAGSEESASGNSEPDLATKPKPLRQRSRTRGCLSLGSHGELRFSS